MHDEDIMNDVTSILPAPCVDNYPELNHFVCIGCIGKSAKYTLKASATKSYIDNVVTLKEVQKS